MKIFLSVAKMASTVYETDNCIGGRLRERGASPSSHHHQLNTQVIHTCVYSASYQEVVALKWSTRPSPCRVRNLNAQRNKSTACLKVKDISLTIFQLTIRVVTFQKNAS